MNKTLFDIEPYLFIVFTTLIVRLIKSFSKIPTKKNIAFLEEKGILISEYIKRYKKNRYVRCVYIMAINLLICFLYAFDISEPDTDNFYPSHMNNMMLLLLTIISLSIILISFIIYFDTKKQFNKNNNLKYIINNIPDDLYEMVYPDIKRNEIDI